MKLIKTKLSPRMEDEFLTYYLVVYTEREIANDFITNMIMGEFYFKKDCPPA
jgi:hypothetical protein